MRSSERTTSWKGVMKSLFVSKSSFLAGGSLIRKCGNFCFLYQWGKRVVGISFRIENGDCFLIKKYPKKLFFGFIVALLRQNFISLLHILRAYYCRAYKSRTSRSSVSRAALVRTITDNDTVS